MPDRRDHCFKVHGCRRKIKASASILNISGGADTPEIVRKIRETIRDPHHRNRWAYRREHPKTIEAGANAISYTPPSNGDLFRIKMDKYRETAKKIYMENEGAL